MSARTRRTAYSSIAAVAAFVALRLATAGGPPEDPSLPFAETPYVLGDSIGAYESFMMSGGPPPDGIPAIEEPRFIAAAQADLEPGDMVIGIHHGGEARAYPQRIMVWHEIVNDRVGGLNVSVTYCPLTATAQGFKRGETTFGVSGQLLNSNMVIFDRETGSYFSQIAATGLTGEHRGRTLDEIDVVWTTWDRWRSAHPETRVLSTGTGHLRTYDRDPYGSYNPVGGYYAQNRTLFPLLHASDHHHSKEMVVGGRTHDRSVHFVLAELAGGKVLRSESFLAVYDPAYHTGRVYLAGETDPQVVARADGTYELAGEAYAPDELPLESVIPVDAFFFAWNAFYPQSETRR